MIRSSIIRTNKDNMNLQEIFIEIDALSRDDRDALYDALHRQRIIERESEILANRAQAHRSIADGTIRRGTARDLITELNQEDDNADPLG